MFGINRLKKDYMLLEADMIRANEVITDLRLKVWGLENPPKFQIGQNVRFVSSSKNLSALLDALVVGTECVIDDKHKNIPLSIIPFSVNVVPFKRNYTLLINSTKELINNADERLIL